MNNAIENPWCIRKDVMFFPVGIGKIMKEHETSAYVQYSEGQLYMPEVWDKNYLERFPIFEEMVKKYAEYEKMSLETMMELCLRDFPSQKNN